MEVLDAINNLKSLLKNGSGNPDKIDKAVSQIEQAYKKDTREFEKEVKRLEEDFSAVKSIARRIAGMLERVARVNSKVMGERDDLEERVERLLEALDIITDTLGDECGFNS